jgi:competence protein ComEA
MQTPSPSPTLTPAQQRLFPDTPARATFLRVCTRCHAPEKVVSALRTKDEWRTKIGDMARLGAEASDQEFEDILTYLVASFSPIPVNIAAADELTETLGISREAASALVAYRTEHGSFKSIDDIKQVQGVDAAKVDARRDRLSF